MRTESFVGNTLESVEAQLSSFVNQIKHTATFIKRSAPYINKNKFAPYQIDVVYEQRNHQLKTQFN